MSREFQSIEAAHRMVDGYAAAEPRLNELWRMCRWATPPRRNNDDDASYDVDHDDNVDKSWCAETYFFQEVKPKLMLLVGWYRPRDPQELRTSDAYDDVYAALYYALNRTCACCGEDPEDRWHREQQEERQEEWAREMTERMRDG